MTGGRTVGELIARQAMAFRDRPALLAPNRPTLTYHELAERVAALGAALRAAGLCPADRVALVLPDPADLAVALLATMASMTAVPLDHNGRPQEFRRYLTSSKARAVLVDGSSGSAVSEAAKETELPVLAVTTDGDGWPSGVRHVSGPPVTAADTVDIPRDALVFHTSGTTGAQKVVPLPQAGVCLSAANIAANLELTPRDRSLGVQPLFHAHGVLTPLLGSISAGASLVCLPKFEATAFFGSLGEYRPTWYSAVPTVHQAILREAADHPGELAAVDLRFVRSASASLPEQVLRRLEETFDAPVIEAYGMTETTSVLASNPMPPGKRKAGSVGLPVGCEIMVTGSDGHRLAPGQVGEVVVRGDTVVRGYDNAADDSVFTDGWFHTGDLGWFDEDGYLFLAGRTKEIINRGGVTVSPFEIDRALEAHPAIAKAVAFPVPHATLGEDVAVAVVAAPGQTITEREVRNFAAQHLNRTSIPSRVVLVDTLPTGSTGKVQRLRLHEQIPLPEATFEQPSTDLQHMLTTVWQDALGRDRIGRNDNFFDIGGDSLMATRIAETLTRTTEHPVAPLDIFVFPTISLLAEHIADGGTPAQPIQDTTTTVRDGRARLLRRAARTGSAGEGADA